LGTYRLHAPYERPPLQRRATGFALALAVNAALLLMLLTLGKFAPEAKKISQALIVDLLPESHSKAARPVTKQAVDKHAVPQASETALRKPPPIVIPTKPTIAVPPPSEAKPLPFVPMTKQDLAAGEISSLAKAGAGSGGDGDSEVVGTGPHGETLYKAEWARRPTSAELAGYLPANAHEGYGLVACKTIPGDRVEDCEELDQTPGSRLASAVRQAAWQFRVRPPRKNGVPQIGSWVRILIQYE
jgi:protein TonB